MWRNRGISGLCCGALTLPIRWGGAVGAILALIGAAALMRPSKSVQDMELKSLKKKFKDKKFAAGCSRDVIERGAEMLGWELDKLIDMTIQAMRTSEYVE